MIYFPRFPIKQKQQTKNKVVCAFSLNFSLKKLIDIFVYILIQAPNNWFILVWVGFNAQQQQHSNRSKQSKQAIKQSKQANKTKQASKEASKAIKQSNQTKANKQSKQSKQASKQSKQSKANKASKQTSKQASKANKANKANKQSKQAKQTNKANKQAIYVYIEVGTHAYPPTTLKRIRQPCYNLALPQPPFRKL